VTLREDYYDTLAGYMLGKLGRLAKVGDSLEADGVKLKVEALDGRRIARLTLSRSESQAAEH
jgi:putative hemolysin